MNKKLKEEKSKRIKKLNKKLSDEGKIIDDGIRDQFPSYGHAPKKLSDLL